MALWKRIAKTEAETTFQKETAEAVAKAAKPKSVYFGLLGISIVSEVSATIALKASEGFTVLAPSLVTVVGYAIAISLLVVILRHLPLGLVYGIWGGIGTVVTMLVGVIVWHDPFTWVTAVAVALIVGGVYLLNKGTDELEAKRAQQQ